MNSYSAEDKQAFKLKDILNTRMSAIKAAATNHEGQGVSTEVIVQEADVYFFWLYQDQEIKVPEKPKVKTVVSTEIVQHDLTVISNEAELPTPTLEQQKVLTLIAAKLNLRQDNDFAFNGIKKSVLLWAKEVSGKEIYPTKESSVDKFITWFKEK